MEKTLKEILEKMMRKKTVRERICAMLIGEAQNGNFKALDAIRDIIGDKDKSHRDEPEPVTNIKIEVIDGTHYQNQDC